MPKLLPILLIVLGGALGAGAGIFLKPAPEMECDPSKAEAECKTAKEPDKVKAEDSGEDVSYVAMKNQFVVPVIQNEMVRSLVVLSLSLESPPDEVEVIYSREPKLRDVFLQVLFDHSHIGGFNGAFTESSRLSALKVALLEAAQSVLGPIVTDVIVTDIVRQEM